MTSRPSPAKPSRQAQPPASRSRRALLFLGLTCLLALLLRLWVCAELADTPAVQHPSEVTDMETYRRLALGVLHGEWPRVFDYQPFYYTLFLPFAYLFSPDGSPWPPMILQALVGTAACLLTGLAAERLYGRKAGCLAALFLALSRLHLFYTPFLLLEVCLSFWTALALYCAVRLMEKPTPLRAAALGLACAGALLTRGTALLWIPGLILLLLWRGRAAPGKALPALGAMLLCLLLPILPYAIHNSRATGKLSGASVAGGKVLALGNSPEAPAGGLEYPRTYYAWTQEEEQGGAPIPRQILRWAFREPLSFLELKGRALLLFWDHQEIPNNVSLEREGKKSALLGFPLLLPWAFLGALGLAGFLLELRQRRKLQRAALLWLAFAFWFATAAFYLLARFRVGFLPLLSVLAAGFAMRLWHLMKPRTNLLIPWAANRAPFFRLVFLLLLSFYLVNFAHDGYCYALMPAVQRWLHPQGLALSFPQERVLYDHGPLGFGGSEPLPVADPVLQLEKRFSPPRELQSEEPRPQTLLVRCLLPVNPSLLPPPEATLQLNGTPLPAQASGHRERSAQWLKLDFQAPLPPQAAYAIALKSPLPPEQWAIVLDCQRRYGNTRLQGKPLEAAEAVAELVLPTHLP